eukprot:CAMPEP_0178428894 /NCGR_PEP_ID=MMETSP0689_2-20121128/30519_1 /TAXON_ID=160604 /ORGANISM="Amphidinium massartii, Strain CS-259" /LENGTH=182 /DNA_ID=CAMNT_0020050693 /DNA_START=46 /DNA_END=597 /DNA_ORIENTATION=-
MGNRCCDQGCREPVHWAAFTVLPADQGFAGVSSSVDPEASEAPAVVKPPEVVADVLPDPDEVAGGLSSPWKERKLSEPFLDWQQLVAAAQSEGGEPMAITINKAHIDEKLGIELCCPLGCEIVLVKALHDGCAAARQAATGDGLQVGDKIVKVNDAEGDINRMLSACGTAVRSHHDLPRISL